VTPFRRASDCFRVQSALVELLDDPLGEGLDPDSRAHLESCPACRDEITAAMLTSRRLRQTFTMTGTPTPDADAWPRLRDRVLRARAIARVGRAASPVLGLALSTGLAVALMVPLAARSAPAGARDEAGVLPAAIRAAGARDAADEARQLRATSRVGKEASSDDADTRARAVLIRLETAPVTDWGSTARNPRSTAAR
jgi:hypothetical protein